MVRKINNTHITTKIPDPNVHGIPTMLFVNNGKIVNTQEGILPEAMLKDLINQFLESIPVAK